jgi:hypothetical protein
MADKRSTDESDGMASVLAQMAQMQQETARLLLEMKQSGSGGNADVIEQLLQQQQQLLVKTRPENAEHPGISVYSYPEGDLARPKPALKCKVFWCGIDERHEVLTPLEIEWLNKLEPGNYHVTKTDGTRIKFDVAAKYNDRLELEQIAVTFPCRGENRHNHGSKVNYCMQAMGAAIPSQAELLAENQRLLEQVAALRAAVA